VQNLKAQVMVAGCNIHNIRNRKQINPTSKNLCNKKQNTYQTNMLHPFHTNTTPGITTQTLALKHARMHWDTSLFY